MEGPVSWEELEDDRRRIAEKLGILLEGRSRVRTRTRDPLKAALLREAGVPEEEIGPVGPRLYFSTGSASSPADSSEKTPASD